MLDVGYYQICQKSDDGRVYAIDFYGGEDTAGQGVWAYLPNDTDAQLTYIQTWEGQQGQEITFPFSQRCLQMKFVSQPGYPYSAYGCINNYRSANPEAPHLVRFNILPTGSTVSVEGQTYLTYFIKPVGDGGTRQDLRMFVGNYVETGRSRFLGFRGATASPTDRTNEQFYFVKRGMIMDGLYELRPMNDMRWAAGASGRANGSLMYIEAAKDVNSQKWHIFNKDIGQYGIRNIAANKWLTCPKSTEENLIPYLWDGIFNDESQNYSSIGTNDITYNGDVYSTAMIGPQYGTNLRLDIADTEKTGGVTAGNRLMIHKLSGSILQYWTLYLTEAIDSAMSVPKIKGLSRLKKGEIDVVIPRIDHEGRGVWSDYDYKKNGEKRVNYTGYLNFTATTGSKYQVRYRERTRTWSGNWGDWGYWKDWSLDSRSFEGWGFYAQSNVNVEETTYNKTVSKPYSDKSVWYDTHQSDTLAVTTHSLSCKEVQIQVRGLRLDFQGSLPAHSDWQTHTTRLLWEPVTSIDSVKFTPKYGLIFDYSADWGIAGNSLRIIARRENGQKVCDFTTDNSLPAGNGQAIVPMKDLKWIPEFGEKLNIEASYINCDGTWEVRPVTLGVEYRGDYSAPIQSWCDTLNEQESYLANFKTPESKIIEARCWIDVIKGHETHLEECFEPTISEDGSTASVRVCPQYSRKSRIWYYALLDNGKWSINGEYLEEIKPYMCGCTFSWKDDDDPYLMLAMDESAPELSRSYDTNSEKYVTNGREHEIVKFGRTINSSFSLTAKIINDITFKAESELEAQSVFLADRLAYTRGATVIFRSYMGDWARVAITSLSVNRTSPEVNEVEVSMTEVSL